jgi:hypothetical protein
MKPVLILLFLVILLLGGMILHAESNSKKIKIENKIHQATTVNMQQDMQLIPNCVLL